MTIIQFFGEKSKKIFPSSFCDFQKKMFGSLEGESSQDISSTQISKLG